ncbi:MAG: hypothetical protein JNK30_12655 [Phenylobacterium sp.]|uniref:hypothetical protein n=1 Tax=Phenylobacterium sp. TaxID=1871053 RepID=UPI001A42782B|nr:hypothetical protein [Phenylobacterium sp.]MBL8772224.1 hypothetical protein [Phenylobacterium sp.]
MIGWVSAVRDGVILSALASALVVGTLRANPRLLMRHYPVELRSAVPPQTPRERRTGLLIGLLLLSFLIGIPAASTAAWKDTSPNPAAFLDLWAHAFVVGTAFNLTDWLILDELWLGVVRPRWAMLPGAEDVPFRFNHLQHFRGFVVGSVLLGLSALAIAAALLS